MTIRHDITPADPGAIRAIVESSGFFHDYEVDVAVELAEERLAKGEQSGYHFRFADVEGQTVGYTCYGPIACTAGSYDFYWIAVHQQARGGGIGKALIRETEAAIWAEGGRAIWVETYSSSQYEPTRRFYLACGYQEAARMADFYAPGDDKVVYVKRRPPERV